MLSVDTSYFLTYDSQSHAIDKNLTINKVYLSLETFYGSLDLFLGPLWKQKYNNLVYEISIFDFKKFSSLKNYLGTMRMNSILFELPLGVL